MPKIVKRAFSKNLVAALRVIGVRHLSTDNLRWRQGLDVVLRAAKTKGMTFNFDELDPKSFEYATRDVMRPGEKIAGYDLRCSMPNVGNAKKYLDDFSEGRTGAYLNLARIFIERFRNPIDSWENPSEKR